MRVLLSFSLEGSSIGRSFLEVLEVMGCEVTLDQRRLYAREQEIELLTRKLYCSDALVVISMPGELSADSWIYFELGLASGLGKKAILATDLGDVAGGASFLTAAAKVIPCTTEALCDGLARPRVPASRDGVTNATETSEPRRLMFG